MGQDGGPFESSRVAGSIKFPLAASLGVRNAYVKNKPTSHTCWITIPNSRPERERAKEQRDPTSQRSVWTTESSIRAQCRLWGDLPRDGQKVRPDGEDRPKRSVTGEMKVEYFPCLWSMFLPEMLDKCLRAGHGHPNRRLRQ